MEKSDIWVCYAARGSSCRCDSRETIFICAYQSSRHDNLDIEMCRETVEAGGAGGTGAHLARCRFTPVRPAHGQASGCACADVSGRKGFPEGANIVCSVECRQTGVWIRHFARVLFDFSKHGLNDEASQLDNSK